MLSFGEAVDRIVGAGSHVLHGWRGAGENTVGDLGPYLDVPPDILFPAPVVPRDVKTRRPRVTFGQRRVIDTLRWHSQHVVLCPHYRTRHAGEYWLNQRVTARWIHPRSGPRRRALIYVHGWLEPGPWVEEALLLPRLHDDLDVDVLHIQLPFHGSRNPRSALFHGEFFWSADLVRTVESVRQSLIDVRTLMAWLRATQGYEQIGVTGLSLGGGLTMALACVDPTPDYIMPIIGHLKLGEAVEEAPILWRMKSDLEKFGIDRAARKEIFGRLALGSMKPRLDPARQLWIEATDDVYITAALVKQQWEEWGRPPIEWIEGGHMTFPLHINRIVTRMQEFARSVAPVRIVDGDVDVDVDQFAALSAHLPEHRDDPFK
ncbi:MAG: alpha/beta hydrolase family protein [Deltaproteobacteria bacterium]